MFSSAAAFTASTPFVPLSPSTMNGTRFDLTHSFDRVVAWTFRPSILWGWRVAYSALRLRSFAARLNETSVLLLNDYEQL